MARKLEAMALYESIARDLLDAIDAGTYPVGSFIPTEQELARRYDVSRQTVRAAMRRLTELGAVSRRAGSGTRVEARVPRDESFQQTLGSLADLVALAAATRRDVRAVEPVVMDRRMAQRFGCPPGSRWVCVSYLRDAARPKTAPLAWVDCYVEESYADAVTDLAGDSRLVSEIIAARYGVEAVEVRQTVAACALPAAAAGALGAEAGSPALSVIRRYLDARGRIYEISESMHPGERYAVTSVLKRRVAPRQGG